MPFIDFEHVPKHELFPNAFSALVSGEHLMLSFLELAEGADVPEHAHPEEQAGIVMEGKLQLRIGDEEKVLAPGQAYIVPPNVLHSATVIEAPLRVLDIFGPPRADYQAKIDGPK